MWDSSRIFRSEPLGTPLLVVRPSVPHQKFNAPVQPYTMYSIHFQKITHWEVVPKCKKRTVKNIPRKQMKYMLETIKQSLDEY